MRKRSPFLCKNKNIKKKRYKRRREGVKDKIRRCSGIRYPCFDCKSEARAANAQKQKKQRKNGLMVMLKILTSRVGIDSNSNLQQNFAQNYRNVNTVAERWYLEYVWNDLGSISSVGLAHTSSSFLYMCAFFKCSCSQLHWPMSFICASSSCFVWVILQSLK